MAGILRHVANFTFCFSLLLCLIVNFIMKLFAKCAGEPTFWELFFIASWRARFFYRVLICFRCLGSAACEFRVMKSSVVKFQEILVHLLVATHAIISTLLESSSLGEHRWIYTCVSIHYCGWKLHFCVWILFDRFLKLKYIHLYGEFFSFGYLLRQNMSDETWNQLFFFLIFHQWPSDMLWFFGPLNAKIPCWGYKIDH